MHRVCYGIIAFEKPEHIKRKIDALYTEEDFFIIHWNKRSSPQEFQELKDMFKDVPNVHIYSKFRIHWGHISILNAGLNIMKLGLKLMKEFDHLIILSQQCYPIKSVNYIKTYLGQYKDRSVVYGGVNEIDYSYDTWGYHVFTYKFYWFLHPRNINNLNFSESLLAFFVLIKDFFYHFPKVLYRTPKTLREIKDQYWDKSSMVNLGKKGKIIKIIEYYYNFFGRYIEHSLVDYKTLDFHAIDRTNMLEPIYKSNCFFKSWTAGPFVCLTRNHIEYIFNNKKAQKMLKIVNRTFAPEEYYIQSVLFFSPFFKEQCVYDEPIAISLYGLPENLYESYKYDISRLFDEIDQKWESVLFIRKIEDVNVMAMLDEYRQNN